jgi:hypothetical protein
MVMMAPSGTTDSRFGKACWRMELTCSICEEERRREIREGSCAPEKATSLAGCGKTMLARQNVDGPFMCLRRAQSSGTTDDYLRRMLKKAVQQGRSERRCEGVRFGTLSF